MATNAETASGGIDRKRARLKRGTTETTATGTTAAPQPATRSLGIAKPPSKSAAVIKLLSRPKGANGPEIAVATDWQPHSVRAYLTGLRKKGHALLRLPRKDGELSYRLTVAAAPLESSPASVNVVPQTDGSDGAGPESVDPAADNNGATASNAAAAAAA